jgi:hypothetical protein
MFYNKHHATLCNPRHVCQIKSRDTVSAYLHITLFDLGKLDYGLGELVIKPTLQDTRNRLRIMTYSGSGSVEASFSRALGKAAVTHVQRINGKARQKLFHTIHGHTDPDFP